MDLIETAIQDIPVDLPERVPLPIDYLAFTSSSLSRKSNGPGPFLAVSLNFNSFFEELFSIALILPSVVFFLQGYIPGLWGHTWSLAVEEHFYLLLPLILQLMIRLHPTTTNPFARRLPLFVAGFAVVELALRLATASWWGSYNAHRTHLFPTHLRLDSLFFGVLLAYWYHFYTNAFFATQAKWGRWLLFGGAALLIPAFIYTREENEFVYTFGFTSNYVGSGAVLVGMLSLNIPENRLFRVVATIGRNSYSIYLWHIPFIVWGIPQIETAYGSNFCYAARVVLFVVGSVVLGIIMTKMIEGPTLRMRDRWFPSRIGKFDSGPSLRA